MTRVPFGPGPYGVSQSWFFDQHYYVGLADDMDLGVKYVTKRGNWDLDLAYFVSSEGNWNGTSEDSARYSYDAVKWTSALDEDGNLVSAPVNGYEERNQFNLRAIYSFDDMAVPTDLGVSLQYGQLKGKRADDGHHWAASAHMVNQIGNFKLASQLTRYEIRHRRRQPLGYGYPDSHGRLRLRLAGGHQGLDPGSVAELPATRPRRSAGSTTCCPTWSTAASSRTRATSTTARW